MQVFNQSFLCGIAILFLLTGCGGGSGGGGDGTGDTDGDGLTDKDEIELYQTSPVLADTDGDGFSDYEEIIDFGFDPANNQYKFNPLVADTPKMAITLTSPPDIDIFYLDTNSVAETKGTSRNETVQSTLITTNATTNGTQVSDSHQAGGSAGTSSEKGAAAGVDYKFTHTTTQEDINNWSQTRIEDHKLVVEEYESRTTEQEYTTTGGALSYSVTVKNEGDIAFTLSFLTLSAKANESGQFGEPGNFSPVGNLDLNTTFSTYPATTLGPGGSTGDLVFSNNALDTGTVLNLLRDSSGLTTEVGAYEVLDENGRSYVHDETRIASRTALVMIDFAPTENRKTERYAVATNSNPNSFGITSAQALEDILGITYNTTNGRLNAVRDVVTDASIGSEWLVIHQFDDGTELETHLYDDTTPYDFDSILLKSGHVLHMVQVKDADSDGLTDRQEILYRTNPRLADTDADTLVDLVEVTGWTIDVNGISLDVSSDPNLVNGDGDGLSDPQEFAAVSPTDPFDTDTDGDRLNDDIDPFPITTDEIDISDLTTTSIETGSPSIRLDWTAAPDTNNITTGVLWLYRYNADGSTDFPDPDSTPVDGQLYNDEDIFGGNDWKVLRWSAGEVFYTKSLGAGASGSYKFIAYINVDLNGDDNGDRYVRSAEYDTVAFAIPSDTLEVVLDGLFLDRCNDDLIFIFPYVGLVPDEKCELYWTVTANGQVLNKRLESNATEFKLSPTQIYSGPSPIVLVTLARFENTCLTIRADVWDSDTRNTSTRTGDEHGKLIQKICYSDIAGWRLKTNSALVANTPKPYAGSLVLSGGTSHLVPNNRRTKLTVNYTVTLVP